MKAVGGEDDPEEWLKKATKAPEQIEMQTVTGLANLIYRIQGE